MLLKVYSTEYARKFASQHKTLFPKKQTGESREPLKSGGMRKRQTPRIRLEVSWVKWY